MDHIRRERDERSAQRSLTESDRFGPYPQPRMQTWDEVARNHERQQRFGRYARQIEADVLRALG
jgi:hypothetical protein